MKEFRWSESKNKSLKKTRDISFEEILKAKFLGAKEHPSRENQMILLFEYKKYVWFVPCIVEGDYIFLKTAFPSRKYTKKHKRGDE